MFRRLRIPLFLAALAVVAACDSGSKSGPFVGQPAPDIRLTPVKPGGDVQLSDFKGKVVVLDFWATWCGPCRNMMPEIMRLSEKYKDKGVVVMGVSAEDRAVVQEFREANSQINYDLYLDRLGTASNLLKANSLPTTVVVGKDGNVVYWDTGFGETTMQEIEEAITKSLEAS